MMKTQTLNTILLMFSSLVLFTIAMTFGADPKGFTSEFYDIEVSNINASHIFRSVMGLIIGTITFWIYAAINKKYALPALYSLMFVMFGLVLGRTISFVFDEGSPVNILSIYFGAELVTGITAFLLIRKNHKELNL